MNLRVATIGVGTIGAQALWHLAEEEGVEVVGYERFTPGNGLGAAGGDGRVFRVVQYEDEHYVPLIQTSNDLWSVLQERTGRELKLVTGGLIVGSKNHVQIQTALAGVRRYGLDCDVVDAGELRRRFPLQTFHDDDLGIIDHGAGLMRPELTNLTTTELAVSLGARMRANTPVTSIESDDHGVTVTTEAGDSERFDQVLIANGAWAQQVVPALESLITTKKVVSAWYFPRDPQSLQGFPAFVRTSPLHCYGVPSQDGLTVKLGLSSVLHEPVASVDASDRIIREVNYAPFNELLDTYFPGLFPYPVRTETYFEGYTDDARPILQRVSDRVTIAAGFSGHGFKLAPAYGHIAADLVLDHDPGVDLEFFSRDELTV